MGSRSARRPARIAPRVPPDALAGRHGPPVDLLEGEDGEGREPPGEDELHPQPQEEEKTGEDGPGRRPAPRACVDRPSRAEKRAAEEKRGEADRALVDDESRQEHGEHEAGGHERTGPHAQQPRGEPQPQQEEDRALDPRRDRVPDDPPEGVEGHGREAADVHVGPERQRREGEREAEVVVPAAVPDQGEVSRQLGRRAAERVVVDELVHVVGDRARGEPRADEKQGRARAQPDPSRVALHRWARLAAGPRRPGVAWPAVRG